MSDVAIRVEGLGKKYRIGARRGPYKTLRESLTDVVTWPARRLRAPQTRGIGEADSEFWALQDVGFDVRHGEVLGIIGRNGAGKSTLLKLLSRITEPTRGSIAINGRVAALLEVGTGFHHELTGRENVLLNGAILGMTRTDIARRFDEIVAFAEVERFIDTQVKFYSSGMYLRLAFSVAAHLEPEILIVDEVLAVGDLAFQKKCMGKMESVSGAGRTVLFVSHNMAAITTLCARAILLERGSLVDSGPTRAVVDAYIAAGLSSSGEAVWSDPDSAPGNDTVRLHAVRIVSEGTVTGDVAIDQDVEVQVDFWNYRPGASLLTSIHLKDAMGIVVLATTNIPSATIGRDDWFGRPYPAGLFRSTCILPGNFLNEGTYKIKAHVLSAVNSVELYADDAVSFTVHETGSMRQEYTGTWIGVIRPRLPWRTELLELSTAVAGG